MVEEWKPIPGYEGLYDVSDQGRVRSHDRTLNRKHGTVNWKGRILKPQKGSKGHYGVNLRKNGRPKTHYIHRLVAEVFLPNPDNHPVVRHLNDVKEDNTLENLAWGTHTDNAQDAIRNGRSFDRQAHKTHCPRGHPYSGENLYIPPGRVARHCRACKTDSQRSPQSIEKRRIRRTRGLPPGDHRHGTLNGYSNYGCRCDLCSVEWKNRLRERSH